VDQQLASLLVNFWTTGDLDSAKVLADRVQELPAEDADQQDQRPRGRPQGP